MFPAHLAPVSTFLKQIIEVIRRDPKDPAVREIRVLGDVVDHGEPDLVLFARADVRIDGLLHRNFRAVDGIRSQFDDPVLVFFFSSHLSSPFHICSNEISAALAALILQFLVFNVNNLHSSKAIPHSTRTQ